MYSVVETGRVVVTVTVDELVDSVAELVDSVGGLLVVVT